MPIHTVYTEAEVRDAIRVAYIMGVRDTLLALFDQRDLDDEEARRLAALAGPGKLKGVIKAVLSATEQSNLERRVNALSGPSDP